MISNVKELYPHELYTSFTPKTYAGTKHRSEMARLYSAVCMAATMQTLVCIVVTMPTCFAGSCLFASFLNIIGLYLRLAQPDILPLLTICYWQFDSWTCDAVVEIGTMLFYIELSKYVIVLQYIWCYLRQNMDTQNEDVSTNTSDVRC